MREEAIDGGFNVVRTHVIEGKTVSRLEKATVAELTAGDVVVRTLLAGVNYKDCLSLHGRAKIIRGFPRIAGIELVGEVVSSDSPEFKKGDAVILHGFSTGIAYDGAFSEYVRVPSQHLLHLPARLSVEEAAILGVPAVTAAIAVEQFEAPKIDGRKAPVAVTGATGSVGLMAINILQTAGYDVAAVTRRPEHGPMLRDLGCTEVVDSSDLSDQLQRPLNKEIFSAAIDNVGGSTLAWLLSAMHQGACVASVGNSAGNTFDGNVLPFILRAVRLIGIVANPPLEIRRQVWDRLAGEWKPDFVKLRPHVRFIRLEQLLETSVDHLEGKNLGRILIDYR